MTEHQRDFSGHADLAMAPWSGALNVIRVKIIIRRIIITINLIMAMIVRIIIIIRIIMIRRRIRTFIIIIITPIIITMKK